LAEATSINNSSVHDMQLRHAQMKFYYVFSESNLPIKPKPVTIFIRNILELEIDGSEFEITGVLYEDLLREKNYTMPSHNIIFTFCTIKKQTIGKVILTKFVSEFMTPT